MHMKRLFIIFFLNILVQAVVVAQDVAQIAKQKPFALSGSLGIGLGTYNVKGIPARQRDFNYIFNDKFTIICK